MRSSSGDEDSGHVESRTESLQKCMSLKSFPSLPGMRARDPPRESYHKHQRFKVKVGGRRFEEVKDSLLDASLPFREVSAAEEKNSSFKSVSERKQKVLRQWEALNTEEAILKQRDVDMKCAESKFDSFKTTSSLAFNADHRLETGLRKEPLWLSHDGKVLQFFLYFHERMPKPTKETFRVRKCLLYYFLSDNSIEIQEPKEENSGLPQGVFLKRTKSVFKDDGENFSPFDFKIGSANKICGREFTCFSCDPFTRNYLLEKGFEMGEPLECPEDPFRTTLREEENRRANLVIESIAGARKPDTLKQYLENDGKVLKFFCLWDDTHRMFGEKMRYILNYFLADDTIEVRNGERGKNGKDNFPLLFKRAPLYKDMRFPEMGTYKFDHFRCGQFIDVCTRKLLLLSCDKFTKQYYEEKLGIKQPTVDLKFDHEETLGKGRRSKRFVPPPYNGFGGEADTLANCLNLIPKPVRQDLKKFLKNRGKVLQFCARFKDPKPEDEDRRFVVSYFMDDDTSSIYEGPGKNTGFVGGKFLERGKYKIPIKKIKKGVELSPKQRELQRHIQDKLRARMSGGPFSLLRAFRQFAVNENCLIDLPGFKYGLRSIGVLPETAEDTDISELFTHYDKTGDGNIDFQEFVDNIIGDTHVPSNRSEYQSRNMRATDYFVGAQIRFLFPQTGACSQEFLLYKATKPTLKLMEDNCDEFPRSNVETVFANLATALREFKVPLAEVFKQLDSESKGWISTARFGELLKDWSVEFGFVDDLTEHEILTLTRRYDRNRDGKICFSEFYETLTDEIQSVNKLSEVIKEEEQQQGKAFAQIVQNMMKKVREEYDAKSLFQKFQGICKSHKQGVPSDLLFFFLRDELFVDLPCEFEIPLMLRFDTNCNGYVTPEKFVQAFYSRDQDGEQETKLETFLELNSRQKDYDREGFPAYGTILKAAKMRGNVTYTLPKLMKSFSSAFFKRRSDLMKNLLKFDINRKRKVTRKALAHSMTETNQDFSRAEEQVMLDYIFRDNEQVDYETLLQVFFSQDINTAKELYGEFVEGLHSR